MAAMAALAAGQPGAVRALPVTCACEPAGRAAASGHTASSWMEEGPLFLELDDLALARDSLQALLRPQLPFQIKMVVVCSMYRAAREGVTFTSVIERACAGFDLAPWKVLPRSNVDERMARIIAAARNKFEKHLENLCFRKTDWTVEGILGLRVLATPSTELLDLPAPGVAAELGEAQVGGLNRVRKLPPELSNNKGIWNLEPDKAAAHEEERQRQG